MKWPSVTLPVDGLRLERWCMKTHPRRSTRPTEGVSPESRQAHRPFRPSGPGAAPLQSTSLEVLAERLERFEEIKAAAALRLRKVSKAVWEIGCAPFGEGHVVLVDGVAQH